MIDADSSWWPVLHEIEKRSDLTVVLLGSAAYMNEEGWFAGKLSRGSVRTLELGYRTPPAIPKITLEEFESMLKQSDDVISI